MSPRRAFAAVAAAALLLAACDDSGGEPDAEPDESMSASSEPSGSATSDPGPVVECPEDVVEVDPGLPDAVPEGATSVRLCAGADDEVAPPQDALTTDVAAVVGAVNGQQVTTRNCADRQLPSYQLAFGYPDGSSFVVAGRFTGCGELLVGSARRARSGPALHRFVDLLTEQRSTQTPPDAVAADSIDCAQPRSDASWPLGDPVGLTVAVLCFDGPGQPRRVEIRPADLRALVASIRRDVEPIGSYIGCALPLRGTSIVGANAWGDLITMTWDCLGFAVTDDLEWQPRGRARTIVGRLVAEAR